MRLRGRKKQCGADCKALDSNKARTELSEEIPATHKAEGLNDGIVFPKTRRRLRNLSTNSKREENKAATLEKSRLVPENDSEGVTNLRKPRRKPSFKLKSKCFNAERDEALAEKKEDAEHVAGSRGSPIEMITDATLSRRVESGKSYSSTKAPSRTRKRGKNMQTEPDDLTPLLSSPEKQARLKTNISPCSVQLEKTEIIETDVLFTKHKDESQKLQPSTSEKLFQRLEESSVAKKLPANRNAPLSDEDFFSLLGESPPRNVDVREPLGKISAPLMKPSRSSKLSLPGETTLCSENFYSKMSIGKKAASTPQASATLNAWLKTAKNTCRSKEGTSSEELQSPPNDKWSKSHKIPKNSKMKRTNMHTPLEARRISRLESTPQISSSESEANFEQDLFGFEKLLRPASDFLGHISPIPRPKIPKELKSKKKNPLLPEQDKGPKAWEGLLDITNSHLSPKMRLGKQTRNRKHHKLKAEDNEDNGVAEVYESSEIRLFDVTPIQCEEKETIYDYMPDDELPEVKSKRNKLGHKAASANTFDIANALPWQEINEHELVVETV